MLQKEEAYRIHGQDNFFSGTLAKIPDPVLSGILSVLAASMIAIIIGNGGMVAALGFVCLPFLIGMLVLIFKSPRIGLFVSIHSSFAILALEDYLPVMPFPIGLSVDFFLLVTVIATLIKVKREDWKVMHKGLFLLLAGWFLFTVLEIFNPEAKSMLAWVYAIRQTSLQMFLTVTLSLLLLKNPKDLHSLLMIWLIWSVIAAFYGMRQLHIGLTDQEKAWLAGGAARTHVLFGKLRAFSIFTDAGSFGAAQAMAVVIAGIIAINTEGLLRKAIYGSVAALCLYGMLISGTRGAMFVLIAGFGSYFLISGNLKVLIGGFIFFVLLLGGLKFTTYGNENYNIRRMRTALNPDQDASFQVRVQTKKILSDYLASRPFGGGIGSIGYWGTRFSPNTFLGQKPTDSWYVRIWAETGQVGLTYYLLMLGYIFAMGFRKVFVVQDKSIKYKIAAFYAAVAGLAVASYGNELWGAFPIAPFSYVCIALIFNGTLMERLKSPEKTGSNPLASHPLTALRSNGYAAAKSYR